LEANFASNIVIFKNHRLVTSGIYSFIRHPLHLGIILELLGMSIIAANIIILTMFVFICIIIIYRNRREDKALVQIFGDEARSYIKSVYSLNILYAIWNRLNGHVMYE